MLSPVRSASNRAVTSRSSVRPRVPAHQSATTRAMVVVAIPAATQAITFFDNGCIGGSSRSACGIGDTAGAPDDDVEEDPEFG